MEHILLVILLLVALAMIGLILLQRSDDGSLGLGGNNFSGGMSVRGAASILSRGTSILAAAFMVISLLLAVIYSQKGSESILDSDAAAIEAGDVVSDEAASAMDEATEGTTAKPESGDVAVPAAE